MLTLPQDLVNSAIIPKLDHSAYLTLRRVCRKLNQTISLDHKWTKLLREAFNEETSNPFTTLIKRKVAILRIPPDINSIYPGIFNATISRWFFALADQNGCTHLHSFDGKPLGRHSFDLDLTVFLHPYIVKIAPFVIYDLRTRERMAVRDYQVSANYIAVTLDTIVLYKIEPILKKVFEFPAGSLSYRLVDEHLVITFFPIESNKVKIFNPKTNEVFLPKLKWPSEVPVYTWGSPWVIENKGEERVLTNYLTGKSYPLKSCLGCSPISLNSRYVQLSKSAHFIYYDIETETLHKTNRPNPHFVRVFDDIFYLIYEKELAAFHPQEKRLFTLSTDHKILKIIEVRWPFILLRTEKYIQIFHLPRSVLLKQYDSNFWIFGGFNKILYKPHNKPFQKHTYSIEI